MAIANITNNILTDSGVATSSLLTTDTSQAITANKSFTVGFSLASEGLGNQTSFFRNTSSIFSGSGGSNIFGFNNSNNIYFGKGLNNGGVLQWNNTTATRYYTLPDADGTIALTSNIPANAVGGTGTTNTLSKFTASTTIGNSSITDDGTIVSILNSSFTDVLRVGSTTRFLYFYPDSGSVNIMTGAGFTGSGITFAGFSNYLDFNTNSLTRMRLTTAGNLVLGPNPFTDNGARLQVSGTANFTDNVQSSSFFRSNTPRTNSITIGVSANTNYGYIGNDNMWGFRTGTSGDFNVDVNNSSSPINAFKIAQNGAATFSSSVKAGNFIVSEKSTGGLLMGATNGIDADIVLEVSASGAATKFGSIGSSGTGNLVLAKNGGNVGIGTSLPTAKLEIQNSPANDWGLSVWGNTTTGQSYGGIVRGGTNASDVAFRVNNAANSLTYFTVQGNGKVGIGTSTPDNSYQGLTISGVDPSLRLKTTSGSGWVWTEYVTSAGVNNFSMGVNQTIPYFGIKAGAGLDNPNFAILSSGNVLIGTTTDFGNKLTVNGNAFTIGSQGATQFITSSGSTSMATYPTFTTFYTVSNYQNSIYLVTLQLNGYSNYTAYATICQNDSGLVIMNQVNNVAYIQVSGLNIQGSQNSGNTQNMIWRIIKIG